MADLKPIGSEKLTGQNKLNRIMEIARFNESTPKSINETSKSEYSVSLADGHNYEIIRERQGYVIKKTISESNSNYIDNIKNRKYYSSYAQAFKRLNLVAGELNRLNNNDEGVSLYGEQKKFILKTPKPEVPAETEIDIPIAPPSVPFPELPAPTDDEAEDVDVDAEVDMDAEDVDAEVDTEDGQVTFKTIQKLTGKLTQKIRTLDAQDGMTSEDIKYVINMVLSSLDLTAISEEDKEDIVSKFDDLGGDDMEGEDLTDDSEVEDIQAGMDIPKESEMGESEHGAIFDSIFKESKVDKVISKYFEKTPSEVRTSKEKEVQKSLKTEHHIRTIMESVIKMTETIEQELSSKKFLIKNPTSKFIGITNKKNLVFENNKGQVRISPSGSII